MTTAYPIDLSLALTRLYPHAQWVLSGRSYAGLDWRDQTIPKPSEEELIAEAGRILEEKGADTETEIILSGVASHAPMRDAFVKADPDSVVLTRTAGGAISIKAGTVVGVGGTLVRFKTDTAVVLPTLVAGTDYAVYVCADGTVRADANFKAPVGYTADTARKIGGFHYAPGGNATAQKGGDTSPAINPYSLWDLKFRPACADPRGMTLVAGGFWADIYLLGVDHVANGTSRYNVTIADGSSPPKIPAQFGGNGSRAYSALTWWEAAEVMASHGKKLPSYAEFAALAYGATEASSLGSDPVSTVLNAAYTSKWGVIQATGCLYVWGREFGGSYHSGRSANTGSRGSTYDQPCAVLLGGSWKKTSDAGSRRSNWYNAPSNSYEGTGARGVCAHRVLV